MTNATKKNLFGTYSSRGLKSMTVVMGSMTAAGGQACGRSRQRELAGMMWAFEASNYRPSGILPPQAHSS